jgi:hypothetical protein
MPALLHAIAERFICLTVTLYCITAFLVFGLIFVWYSVNLCNIGEFLLSMIGTRCSKAVSLEERSMDNCLENDWALPNLDGERMNLKHE